MEKNTQKRIVTDVVAMPNGFTFVTTANSDGSDPDTEWRQTWMLQHVKVGDEWPPTLSKT